jgi:hypothetical protein
MDDPTTFWTAIAAIATATAAIVAGVSAVIIALQTRATRKAAVAGAKAADAAVQAADAAVAALGLAQREQNISRFLATEAVRVRLDSRAPRIVMVARDTGMIWPPLWVSSIGEPQAHPADRGPFRMPKDGNIVLLVRCLYKLRNDGDSAVQVRLSQPSRIGDKLREEVWIEPHDEFSGSFDVQRTVAEWVAIWEERDRTRGPVDDFIFEAVYLDQADAGVIDNYRAVLAGTIVKPVPNETGAWELIDGPGVTGEIGSIVLTDQPTRRRYFLSRERGIELPEPDGGHLLPEAESATD